MEYIENVVSTNFKRFCKTLELKDDPSLIEEYKKIHSKDRYWPEIARGMKEVGILDMEIYIFGTRLFMIMDTVPDFDHDKTMAMLAKMPRQQEWETFASTFQKTTPGATAGNKWKLIERIFKL
jgi:L-rhamnose mutarotase